MVLFVCEVSDIGNIHALKLKLENFKDDLKQDTELLGTTSKKTNILLNSGYYFHLSFFLVIYVIVV